MPLKDALALFVQQPGVTLGTKFARAFQEKMLDEGNYSPLLDELAAGDFQKAKLKIDFPAAKDGISYPAFQLDFDYFYQENEAESWGIVPALGIEALTTGSEGLAARLEEAIRVEFTAQKRLQAVQQIVATAWFQQAEVQQEEISLTFHSPAELSALQKDKKRELLPKTAEKLHLPNPVAYGRDEELGFLERILKSRFLRNVLIVGPPGIGKTALIWELAHRRERLGITAEIWETTASVLIKELTTDTGWQDNLSFLVKELNQSGDILFVRSLAELFEVGQYVGNDTSMAEYLRSFLSRGELTLITECTPEQRAHIEVRSPNFLSFFQIITLKEPPGIEDIIARKINDLAKIRGATVEPEAILEIIRLHRRFSPYSGMPGKPIRFLESILMNAPPEETSYAITRQSVLEGYCEESGMPAFMVNPELPMDLPGVRRFFDENVFGQEKATRAVADLLATVKMALSRTAKPIASFLFVGPTGVGKTELAKVLAQFMFGSRERLLRFDMSEYSTPWSVLRLVGQGHGTDGLLTSAVRREPFCVLLFDEIEKAAPSFYDLLLQILGEGRLSDSQGKLVNFCSAIIIMTSNIGAEKLQRGEIGWKTGARQRNLSDHFLKAVEENFRPEFVNRIDEIVAFEPLSQDTVRYVVEREIDQLKQREGIRFRHLDLEIADSALDLLAFKGYDARFGARHLQRTLRQELVAPLALTLNRYEYDEHLTVKIFAENDGLTIAGDCDPLGFDLLMEQWDKLTLADQTGDHRRRATAFLESPLYLRFLSDLDRLEGEKKLLNERFWEHSAKAALYSNLLNAKNTMTGLYESIQDAELEIALASMGHSPFNTDFSDRLKNWAAAYFQYKMDLYSLLYPRHNSIHFAVYGVEPERLLPFYLELFKQKGFQPATVKTVWFRENYLEELPLSQLPMPAEEEEELPEFLPETEKKPQPAYPKQDCSIESLAKMSFEPPRKGDRLYGFELVLNAPCIWLYLKDEKGIHQLEVNGAEMFFSVHTAQRAQKTPEEIHRLSFYKNVKPRRTLAGLQLTDKKLGLALEILPSRMVQIFVEKLDEQFKNLLDAAFSGEDLP